MPSEEDIVSKWSPRKRKGLLAIVAVVIVFFLFSLPRNWRWLQERIFPYTMEFAYQWNHQDIEQRKRDRWRNSYLLSRQIDSIFTAKGIKDRVLVLLPPKGYFKAQGITYHVPEPAVFYYYTGLKTTWVTSELAVKANWYVRVDNGFLVLEPVKNTEAFFDSLQVFAKYRTEL